MNSRRLNAALLVTAFLTWAFPSHAGLVTLVGPDLTYSFDGETSFGRGSLIGNDLVFSGAQLLSAGESTLPSYDSQNSFFVTISVNSGSPLEISAITVLDSGFFLTHGDRSIASASSTTSILGQGTGDVLSAPKSIQTSDIGGLSSIGSTRSDWQLTNTNALSWSNEISLLMQIQTTLSLDIADGSDIGWIDLTSRRINVAVNPVPLPGSVWLFASALAAFGLFAKRNKLSRPSA